jgi:hypothetical protein
MVEFAAEGVASISPDVARGSCRRSGRPYPSTGSAGRRNVGWASLFVIGHLAACGNGSVAPEAEESGGASSDVTAAHSTEQAASHGPSGTASGTFAATLSEESSASGRDSDTSELFVSAASTSFFAQSTRETFTNFDRDAGIGVSSDSDRGSYLTSVYVGDGGVGDGSLSSRSPDRSSAVFDAGPEPWTGPTIVSRAGFVEIEPVSYIRNNVARTSSSARLFYSFRPADEDPHLAPTFVFFNGGPGYGTSFGLLPRGTGPVTIGSPEDSTALVSNPWSWTQMGNLLYIDTRQAGLSYSTLADPSVQASRAAENNDTNFNDYLDAADLVRVMLRVLSTTPGIQDNPVVLVGESYGGVRATMMLEFLLDYENLDINPWYADSTLAEEIAAHYTAVADNYADPRDQFPAQVLIQPFIAYTQFQDQAAIMCLPGSKEALIADEEGVQCESLNDYRDPYNIDEDWTWSTELDVVAGQHLSTVSSLHSLLGIDPTQIVGLNAVERAGAFRLEGADWTVPQPGFAEALGVVQPWDAYLVAFNEANFNYDVYDNPYPCVYFSRVIARVATFVTDADADIVVDTPALPTTMMKCQQLLTNPFVDSVVPTHDPETDEPRPGHWTITYNENSPNGAGERKVRWPGYVAGHMVAVSQAQQLFEDVRAFLRESDVIP